MPLTQAKLKSMLSYDPESGDFHWTAGAPQRDLIGMRAGSSWPSCPYFFITISGKRYRAHRLAWLYMTGKWPKSGIDHRDTNGLNNRWANLREATPSQNIANSRVWKKKTLPKGVYLHKNGKFIAQIRTESGPTYLGSFTDPDAAHAAYISAAKARFGDFARAA